MKSLNLGKIFPEYEILNDRVPVIRVNPKYIAPDYTTGTLPFIDVGYPNSSRDFSTLTYTLSYEVQFALTEEEFKSIIEEREV